MWCMWRALAVLALLNIGCANDQEKGAATKRASKEEARAPQVDLVDHQSSNQRARKEEARAPQEMKLIGTWEVLQMEHEGLALDLSDGVTWMTIDFANDELSLTTGSSPPGDRATRFVDRTSQSRYRIDPKASPPTIDIWTTGDRDEPTGGIYRLEGETLKLALPLGTKERPSNFQPSRSTKVLTLKRKKDSQPSQPNRKELVRAMKAQAREVGRAVLAKDYSKVIDLTHPKEVELAGGKESVMRLLKQDEERRKSRGITIESVEYEDPSDIAEADAVHYGIIPFTLEMAGAGRRARGKSFLIAVSSDGGKKWTFVDGNGVDRARVKKLFPNFPEELQLPATGAPVIWRDG